MRRITDPPEPVSAGIRFSDHDLPGLVNRISCACAACLADRDAPLAQDLFRLVEAEGQSPEAAARALGLGSDDGAYLLAGLREDVAVQLVTTLISGRTTGHSGALKGQTS